VVNTAARLSDIAADGEILVTSRVAGAVSAFTELVDMGLLTIKGLSRPIAVSSVAGLTKVHPVHAALGR